MKKLILMQGIPGSGKSTFAKMIQWYHAGSHTYSTDNFWKSASDDDNYDFDPSRLGEAHRWNQQSVALAMQQGDPLIIVDNTNITKKDALPYIVLAGIYEYEIQVVRVETPLEVCIERNSNRPENRRVPEDIIRRMYERMETLL